MRRAQGILIRKMTPRQRLLLLVAAALAAALGAAPSQAVGRSFEPGELLVRFRGESAERVRDLPRQVGVREAVRSLRRNPHVKWAVPNYIAHAAREPWIPNDRGTKSSPPGGWQQLQWNFLPCGRECGGNGDAGSTLESFGGIDAPGAWANLIEAGRPGARGVKVAVVDTGVAYRKHGSRFRRSPDLKRRQFEGGRDFVDGDRHALDENGHGTHIASTIGERTDNRKFVTGLAYRARLIPIRVLDEHGAGQAHEVARGIRWATRRGAKIINLSLEFPGSSVDSCDDVPTVCRAIDRAHAEGAVVISVTGNTGAPFVAYPGRAPNVIATGATTIRGCLADYSGFGRGIDLVAPGGGDDVGPADPQCEPFASGPGIVQLTITNKGRKSGKFRQFGYPHFDGTSMASAHVAGTAALVWAALKERLGRSPTPDEVEARLESTARTDGGLGDRTFYGAGLIDAAAATAP